MKKLITIFLIIISFISGLFVGFGVGKDKEEMKIIEPIEIETTIIHQEMDYFLYGCPNSKKIKKPNIKKRLFNIF